MFIVVKWSEKNVEFNVKVALSQRPWSNFSYFVFDCLNVSTYHVTFIKFHVN